MDISIGALIKTLRTNKGWTQKQLGEEPITQYICTEATISRIERGQRRPSWTIYEQLMYKLGEDPQKHGLDILIDTNERLMLLKNELKYILRKNNDENNNKAKDIIEQLSQYDEISKSIKQQSLLKAKSILAGNNKEYEKMFDFAIAGMRLTINDFALDKISTYILTYDEIMLANQIAISRHHLGSPEESIEVLLQIYHSLKLNYLLSPEKIKAYIMLLFNLTTLLGQSKEYHKSLELCDEGIDLCINQRELYYYPLILFNKVYCLLWLGKKEEGIHLYKEVREIFKCYKYMDKLEKSDGYMNTYWGITF